MSNWKLWLVAHVKSITQDGLSVILLAAVVLIAWWFVKLDDVVAAKVLGKLMLVAMLWTMCGAYIGFLRTRKFDVIKHISGDPIATAIYSGLFVLATALCLCYG